MKTLETLSDLTALLQEHVRGTMVRITYRDVTPGAGLEPLFPNYAIATVHETRELPLLRGDAPVISLEQLRGDPISRTHGGIGRDLLECPEILGAVAKLPGPVRHILPYRLWQETYESLRSPEWHVSAVPPDLRDALDSREAFRGIANEAGIRIPDSRFIARCSRENVRAFYGEHGPLVMQDLGEMAGMGTVFVQDERSIDAVADPGGQPKLLSAYIDGDAIACSGCVLATQIPVSPPRMQVLNCLDLATGFGQFCGNDWNCSISDDARVQIQHMTRAIGAVLRRRGYRGIFGVDAIVQKGTGAVFAIEINPRLLGATQLNTLQQMERDQPTLLGLHVLALLDVDVELSPEAETVMAETVMDGAHVILRNLEGAAVEVRGDIEPGIYTAENGRVAFVRSAAQYRDIRHPGEYLVTMVPYVGMQIGPETQIIRIQAKARCFDQETFTLLPGAKTLNDYLRRTLDLRRM